MHDNQLTDAEREAAAQIQCLLAQFSPEQAERILAHVHHQADARNQPTFSRGRPIGPNGVLDDQLKTWVDAETGGLLRRQLRIANQEVSGFLRDCAYAKVYGKTYSMICAERMLHEANAMAALCALTGPFQGREVGGAHHG
jgi:hypothetical protein